MGALRSSTPVDLAPIIRVDALPARYTPETDREIALRVVGYYEGGLSEFRGVPVLRRALTEIERGALEKRASDLRQALAPVPDDAPRPLAVKDAMMGMLGAFQSMQRHDDMVAAGIVASYLENPAVVTAPPWAVIEACKKVRTGKAGLNPSFCPSEPEFAAVVEREIQPYCARLGEMTALLTARVDSPMPAHQRPTAAEIEAKLGRTVGRAPSGRLASIPLREPMTEQRRQALRADLAARKARNEALQVPTAEMPPDAPASSSAASFPD